MEAWSSGTLTGDDEFLRVVIEAIERIRQKSLERGHTMVASLLDMAKSAAEDELRTSAKLARPQPEPPPELESTTLDDELEADLQRTIAAIRRSE